MRRAGFHWAVAIAVIAWLMPPLALAENLSRRWSFGAALGFLSTTDDIRSNATMNIGPTGADGIPFTFDPGETSACSETVGARHPVFCDPRPDYLLAREATIEEAFKVDLTAGFGLTRWWSLQFDASYFKGDVGPADAFSRQFYPVDSNPTDGSQIPAVVNRSEETSPFVVGEITEIPVSVTAVFRFRQATPLNPYIGVGAGVIFAQLDVSEEVATLNQRLGLMRVRGITNEFGQNITPAGSNVADGRVPLELFVVDVEDALEWHLAAGIEYFTSSRVSLIFDARYMFADQSVLLSVGGEDQVNLLIFPEQLFRADGSVRLFAGPGQHAPNPLCSESPNAPRYEQNDRFQVGCPAIGGNPTTRVQCQPGAPELFDYDGDGVRPGEPDLCYSYNIWLEENHPYPGLAEPRGDVVVQGGSIDLTGFSVAVGVRFHF